MTCPGWQGQASVRFFLTLTENRYKLVSGFASNFFLETSFLHADPACPGGHCIPGSRLLDFPRVLLITWTKRVAKPIRC